MTALVEVARRAAHLLFPVDQLDCYGCHLDRQWVGGELADHSCSAFGRLNRTGFVLLGEPDPTPTRLPLDLGRFPIVEPHPPEPVAGQLACYRGWEVGYDPDAEYWGGIGWRGYRGGCDLDAPEVMAATFAQCLAEVDAAEEHQL